MNFEKYIKPFYVGSRGLITAIVTMGLSLFFPTLILSYLGVDPEFFVSFSFGLVFIPVFAFNLYCSVKYGDVK